jgi:hypothetical protein
VGQQSISAREEVAIAAAKALQQHPLIQLIKPRSNQRCAFTRCHVKFDVRNFDPKYQSAHILFSYFDA